jgi:hypothetical protein
VAKASDELKRWSDRLNASKSKFKPVLEQIDLYRAYYRGHGHWDKTGDRELLYNMFIHHPVENMLFANIRAIVPRLNFRNPKIFVTPRKRPYRGKGNSLIDTTASAVMLEIILNYYYKELSIKREARRCLIDALVGKYGIMQVGYTLKTEKVKKGELLQVDELIKEDSPFAVRRSPNDVLWDIEARDSRLTDARWVGLRWIRPIDDVKRDPRYSNTRNLKGNFTVKTDYKTDSNQLPTNPDVPEIWDRVEGWDMWDKKTKTLYTMVEGHEKFLQKRDWPIDYEGFPIEILHFNENPDNSIPVGDFDIYRHNQDELNVIRAMQLDHIDRLSKKKYKTTETNLDDSAERALKYGPAGTIVTMTNTDKFDSISDNPISQDIYMVGNMIKNGIREMAGVSPTEALVGVDFEQATEPALLERAAVTIREDQRDIFEDFLVRNIRKIGQILQETMDERDIPLDVGQFDEAQRFIPTRLHKIAGEGVQAILPWITAGKEDIKGEYDYDIEIGSTQATNQETRKRDIVQLAQLLVGNPLIRDREATTRVLEAFETKDIDRLMKTPEELQQEIEAAAQQPSDEILERQMKDQTDLQKTQMKSETQLQVAEIKAGTETQKARANILQNALQRNMERRGQR